jgi:hypothetical protein
VACVRVLSPGHQISLRAFDVCCVRGVGCVVHSLWACGYWLDIGLLGIGLGLRAGLLVYGYGFATPRSALLDLASLTFYQTLSI